MSLAFDGVNTHYITSTTGLPPDTDPWTVLMCVKLGTDRNAQSAPFDVRYYGAPANTGHTVTTTSNGTSLRVYTNYGAGQSATVRELQVGQWQWIAARFAGTTGGAKLSVIDHGDDTVYTQSTNQTVFAPTNVFYGASDGTEPFAGTLAYIREWEADLSDSELLEEIASPVPVRTANLLRDNDLQGGDLPSALISALGANFTAPNGGVTYTADAPTFAVEIDCATGDAVAAGVTASVSSPITIACSTGQAVAAGLAAGVSSATAIQAGIGAATASGLTAEVASSVTIACAVGQAEASGLQASISAGAVIDCAVGAAQAAGLPAGVSSAVTIACEVGAAVAEGLQAAVSSDAAILAQAGRAVAAGLPATVSSPKTIAAGVGQAQAAGLPASVTIGAIVLADVGRAVAAGLPATIETVVSLSGWQKPAGKARKYRRLILGDRLYEVLERDIPALLEAELLDRAPPVTAEVIEGPKQPRKRTKKAPQPVKTVEQVRETVQQIKRRIEPDDAWLAQALEAVAFRVLERLQDEEDSLMLLLAA